MAINTENIKTQIIRFIESNEEESDIDLISLGTLKDIMQELGYKKTEYESNGWQCDYQITFEKSNRFTLEFRGSLWDRDYIGITKIE